MFFSTLLGRLTELVHTLVCHSEPFGFAQDKLREESVALIGYLALYEAIVSSVADSLGMTRGCVLSDALSHSRPASSDRMTDMQL